jgi:hypothetical protein
LDRFVKRGIKQLLIITVFLVGGLTLRTTMQEDPPVPLPPAPGTGISCFRQGGEHDYCDCLDRLESARAAAGLTTTELPPLDHPLIRYALRHPRQYPVINADTERCLKPMLPQPILPGSPA